MTAKRTIYTSIISLSAAAVVLSLFIILKGGSANKTHTVSAGAFELAIEVKGEIQGKNAIVISLPDELKHSDLRIYQVKLKDIVEEGTLVRAGDYVATLDAAEITQQMQNNNEDLQKHLAELNDAKIDSSIQLTKLREELGEFVFDLDYKKLEMEQSRYESPAYQRQKKVEYERTIRDMERKKRDYELKKLDLKMKIRRIENRFNFYSRRDSLMKRAIASSRVSAPKEGMIMYSKQWNGRKVRAGDNISIWMPAIATLPDMSQPVSEAYIQEIDITKITQGDSVEVTIDALPGEVFKGAVSQIANVGQELQGFDMKVFRIAVDINVRGRDIKPAMTSNNKILLEKLSNVVAIPRNCLFTKNGDSYVYLDEDGKIWMKEVTPGLENDEKVVIEDGLTPGDKILTYAPDEENDIPLWAER
jgi:multidrug efflux pump subunit AcrA (membrane-fusion protein)